MTAPADVVPEADWQERLLRKGKGKLDAVAANAITILRNTDEWRGVIAFDVFRQDVITTRTPPWHGDDAPAEPRAGEWESSDTVRLQSWLRRVWGLPLSTEAVRAVLLVVSRANEINPLADWLTGLEWDAVRRVDSWLVDFMGAPDTPYTRAMGRWFLISAVARAYDAGCKVDTVPVLEGLQGEKKGQALRILFDPWFSDTTIDLGDKDRFTVLRGVWGYEVAEFDGYSKHDAATLKAYITSQRDNFRAPYAERAASVPRRCVFIATVNPGKEYLADETGGRRFWPVRVGATGPIRLDALRACRAALWAEARELYLAHRLHVANGGAPDTSPGKWWPETPGEHALCRNEQAARKAVDAWDGPVALWLARRLPGAHVTIGDVLGECIGLEKGKWDSGSQQRAGKALRAAGWIREQQRLDGNVRIWVYVAPPAEPAADPAPPSPAEQPVTTSPGGF